MTNLKIAYADIPFNATQIISATANDFNNEYNVASGERYEHYALSSAATTCTITFDLGGNYTSKNAAIDHIVICRADLLQAGTVNKVEVDSSSDNSSWTNRYTDSTFLGAALFGAKNEDYIGTLTATSSFRYWRVKYTATSSTTFRHSKIFLGQFFEFADSPDFTWEYASTKETSFTSTAGVKFFGRTEEQRQKFTLNWWYQTDALVASFFEKVVKHNRACPVVLYTPDEYQILDQKRVVHARLVGEPIIETPYYNMNNVTATFEELVG